MEAFQHIMQDYIQDGLMLLHEIENIFQFLIPKDMDIICTTCVMMVVCMLYFVVTFIFRRFINVVKIVMEFLILFLAFAVIAIVMFNYLKTLLV